MCTFYLQWDYPLTFCSTREIGWYYSRYAKTNYIFHHTSDWFSFHSLFKPKPVFIWQYSAKL